MHQLYLLTNQIHGEQANSYPVSQEIPRHWTLPQTTWALAYTIYLKLILILSFHMQQL
jgi:hypothetical protein